MDAFQRLIEDQPARTPPGRAQRAGEKVIREAVAGLPLANPAQAVLEVEQLLDGMLATIWGGGERLAALTQLRAPVESLCRGIEQQLGGESHPLPSASAERAGTAQRLEWKLATNHATGLFELCAPAGRLPRFKGKLAAGAIVAGLVYANQALVWSYRQYQAPQPGVWRLIHALYAFASELGLAGQVVTHPLADGVPLSARTAYAQTLLLALSNPYRFSVRELKEAFAVICCVAHQCALTRADGDVVSIDTDSDSGPGYVVEERLVAGTGVLALDPRPAVRIIEERIALLPDGADALNLPRPGGGTVDTSAGFLRRLQASWATAERGHARLPATHNLDLVIGMHALHYALAGNLDFSTFIRRIHGEAITVGRHELTSAWLASSDTARPQTFRAEVLDQSEGGYRLRLYESDGVRLRIGEVIGLAPVTDAPDDRDWMVGVIRWLRLEEGREWLGVELLHRTARAAGVRPVTADGESLVPQRAVELPGQGGEEGLALLVTNHFTRDVTAAEVVLPALAWDWSEQASVGVWHCNGADVLGNACIRVNLVRDDHGRAVAAESAE
jgi:hypothetical protein